MHAVLVHKSIRTPPPAGLLRMKPSWSRGDFPSSCRTASLRKHTDTTQASPPPVTNFNDSKKNRVLTWDFYLSVSLGCSKMLFRCWVEHQQVYVVPQRGFPTFTVDSGMTNRNLRGWGNQKKKAQQSKLHDEFMLLQHKFGINKKREPTRIMPMSLRAA